MIRYVAVIDSRTGRMERFDTFPESLVAVRDGELWYKIHLGPDGPRAPGYEPIGRVLFEAETYEESCRLLDAYLVLCS